MKAVIVREQSTDQGTFGVLTLDGHRTWDSLELPWRENESDKSCIPAGNYRAILQFSPKHETDLYHLQGVEPRVEIEIHAANFAGDTDLNWHSDLLGCIALGKARGGLENPEGRYQHAILGSKQAMKEFMEATGGEPLEIEIKYEEKGE